MIYSRSLIALLLSVSLNTLSWAQPSSESPQDPPWYEIELIVFSQGGETTLEQEHWAQPEPLEAHLAQPLALSESSQAVAPLDPVVETEQVTPDHETSREPLAATLLIQATAEQPYRHLDRELLQLGAQADKLSDNSRYTVLLHTGWRQPTLGNREAQPVYLRYPLAEPELEPTATEIEAFNTQPNQVIAVEALTTPITAETPLLLDAISTSVEEDSLAEPATAAPLLEGTLTVSVNRYLRAAVDLRLRDDSEPEPASIPLWSPQGPAALEPVPLDTPELTPTLLQLKQVRRLRSEELHYFDHPALGMLLQIRPYTPVVPSVPEPLAPELPTTETVPAQVVEPQP